MDCVSQEGSQSHRACVCWFVQRSLCQQLDSGCSFTCQHVEQQGSGASSPELTKHLNPAPGSFHPTPVNICIHTGRHWWCFCLCGHWLLCRSAQTRVCLPECLLFVRGLTGNTGSALLLVEHTGMESQQPCFHQATEFSNPLTSCSNSRTCTANMAFLCYHRLQLDVMLNQEKNSLQTRVRCYVSPIFAQAERWKMLQEKLFSFWIILH